jgi:hypothetical protein
MTTDAGSGGKASAVDTYLCSEESRSHIDETKTATAPAVVTGRVVHQQHPHPGKAENPNTTIPLWLFAAEPSLWKQRFPRGRAKNHEL